MEKLVLDPEEGRLWVHWRDGSDVDHVNVHSRHWKSLFVESLPEDAEEASELA